MADISLTIQVGNVSTGKVLRMDKSDNQTLIQLSDVPAAIGLLTRLPVPVDGEQATARGAMAAWAHPIAGLVIALIGGLVGQIALWIGLPAQVVAVFVLLALIFPTGALHEDGLADSADGLWGGWTKERRLEIMKDSRIGAYGVIALVVSLMLRGAALNVLISAGLLWPAVILGATFSRASMVALMARMENARQSGLSHSVGRPKTETALIAAGIAAFLGLLFAPYSLVWLVLWSSLVALGCATLAKAKIGGQTGDILGATGQLVEICVLIVLIFSVG